MLRLIVTCLSLLAFIFAFVVWFPPTEGLNAQSKACRVGDIEWPLSDHQTFEYSIDECAIRILSNQGGIHDCSDKVLARATITQLGLDEIRSVEYHEIGDGTTLVFFNFSTRLGQFYYKNQYVTDESGELALDEFGRSIPLEFSELASRLDQAGFYTRSYTERCDGEVFNLVSSVDHIMVLLPAPISSVDAELLVSIVEEDR